jgi:hypothetical protein
MADYIFLTHEHRSDSAADLADPWVGYIGRLQTAGCFDGGSAIGGGVCARKAGDPPPITRHLTGYIRVRAESLEAARGLLTGHPVFEAGGVVEIRELPRSD